MNPKLLLGLALILGGGLFGCSNIAPHYAPPAASSMSLKEALRKIEQQVPELKSLAINHGVSSSGQVWQGEEYAQATYVLRNKVRYHPAGEFPHETAPVPYGDLNVVITRYASAGAAQKDLEKLPVQRQATFQPKENYRSATLRRYCDATGGVQDAVCRFQQYIVEINCYSQNAEPLTIKTLDVVLAELDSTSHKSKEPCARGRCHRSRVCYGGRSARRTRRR
jgi:hypothetical protein